MKDKIILFDIDYTLFDTDTFKNSQLKTHAVYEEIPQVLKELSSYAELGIFSEGEHAFQHAKLLNTNIYQYFNPVLIHIVESKDQRLEEIFRLFHGKRVFLIDDKLTVLHKAKKYAPFLFTVWVKRGRYAAIQKPIAGFNPDAIINTLSELVPIIAANP